MNCCLNLPPPHSAAPTKIQLPTPCHCAYIAEEHAHSCLPEDPISSPCTLFIRESNGEEQAMMKLGIILGESKPSPSSFCAQMPRKRMRPAHRLETAQGDGGRQVQGMGQPSISLLPPWHKVFMPIPKR